MKKNPHSEKNREKHLLTITSITPLLLSLLAIITTFFFLYNEAFRWLYSIWSLDKVYSHGFVVPLISLYIAWEQRERFRKLPTAPDYGSGLVIILVCLALLLISQFSAIIQIEAISLFFIIPGIILLIGGKKILRASLLSWLYLSFMIPWLDPILNRMQHPFQLASSVMGATLLNFFFPVYRNGVFIQLPNINMEVAAECSGINFFISILAIGIPLVYFTQRTWAKAVLVLVVGCILTMLSNGLRVALAGVMGQCYGPELLHGPGHIFQGWFIAWFGWIGLFLFNWFVAKYSKGTSPLLYERWKLSVTPDVEGVSQQPHLSRRIFFISIFFLLCYGAVSYVAPRQLPLPAALSSLSLQLGAWHGRDEAWLEGDLFFPHADATLMRLYQSTSGAGKVYLYIAYYEQQSEQKRLVSQYSRPLHKGTSAVTFNDALPNNSPLIANQGGLTINGSQYDTVFWYQLPDHVTAPGRNKARVAALTNSIFAHQNAGAIVLLATPHDNPSTKTANSIPAPIGLFLKSAGNAIYELLP